MKNNPFVYSNDNKRYHTLHYYNIQRFGCKVYKAVIDAGFTCPNIDGSKSSGGCSFCDGGSGYFTNGVLSIAEQLQNEKERIFRKASGAKICAYFQANSNTYAPPERLRSIYQEVIGAADAVSIGTRPDCINSEVLDILTWLNSELPLTVELGLQTVHDKTAEKFNRNYSYNDFLKAFDLLKQRKIRTCVHLINGLPKENDEMMLATAKKIGMLRPDAVKLHMLHIIAKTPLAKDYQDGNLPLLEKQHYIDLVVKQLELFPPQTVIERLTGDGDKKKLLAPAWSADKISVLGGIDKAQVEQNSYQGKQFNLL